MQNHIDQALHNEEFYKSLCESFDDKFYDWKITVLFYIALHYLKALAAKRGIDIGNTHRSIGIAVSPFSKDAKMKITKNAWKDYNSLLQYSRTARYDGFTDFSTFEQLMKRNHSMCIQHVDNFKKYINSHNLFNNE